MVDILLEKNVYISHPHQQHRGWLTDLTKKGKRSSSVF
jgi:hypothetical protein